MKKFYTLFIIAAFAAAACQKEIPNDAQTGTPVGPTELTDDNGNPILNPVSISFDASSITKVAIDADGKASWEAGDKIKICCLDAEGTAKYITSGEVNLTDGTFTAVVEDAATYYAVYPSTLEVEQTAESFAVRFKTGRNVSTQFKDAAWYAAKTTKDAKSFAFKSISTVLRFDVENPDAESVYFRSMGGGLTALGAAKYFPVDFADDGSVAVKIPTSTTLYQYITFGGMNGAGTYYLTLPAVGDEAISDDQVPLDGFMLKLNGAKSGIPAAYYSSPITLTPGKLYNLSTSVDDKIVWDYYISETGSGTGLTVDSPASLTHLQTSGNPAFIAIKGNVSMLRDGAKFHIIGTFDDPISVINQKQERVVNIIPHQGSKFTLNVNKAEVTVSFSDQTVSDGSVAFNVTAGTLNINNATFSENASTLFTVSGGQVNVNNTIFEKNTMQIFSVSKGGNLTLKDSKIIDNTFSAENEAAIIVDNTFTGKLYLTNCIFAGNKQNNTKKNVGIAIQCAANTNESAFLGINNCLFFNNAGKATTHHPSHMNLGFAHCIINTTIISQKEPDLFSKLGIRCGATGGTTASLLANNIISNEDDGIDIDNASSSYSLRLKGYNLYTDKAKNVVDSGIMGTVPAYNWTSSTYAWTWNGSTTTEDMVSMSELEALITNDTIDEAPTVVRPMATEFLEWLKAQSYPNGNAFTVDLYGNSRGEGVCWPGCYQLN